MSDHYFSFFQILLGVFLLFWGAEWLVKSAAKIALGFGMDPFVVGMTVVAFSTSSPELLTSCLAQFMGEPGDLALGNVIGSSSANIGFILGLSALLKPIILPNPMRRRDLPLLFAGTLFLGGMMALGSLTKIKGACLVSLFLLIFSYQVYSGKKKKGEVVLENLEKNKGFGQFILVVVSILLLFSGAKILLTGATSIAKAFGISERTIGLTMVAVGGSLPELAATVISAFRGHAPIALGNIIGSNLFNNLFIAGVAALIRPISFSRSLLVIDFPFMALLTLILWVVILTRQNLTRTWGVLLFLLYALYIGFFVF